MNQPTRLNKIILAIRATVSGMAAALLEIFQAAAPGHEQAPAADAHIYELLQRLCGNDPERMQWVLRWLAFPLRTPGARMSTALVVNGLQGCGKSLFFEEIMGKIHERRAFVLQEQLRLRYNDALRGKRYVVVDQPIELLDMAWFKSAITCDQLAFGRSVKSTSIEKNSLNFVFLTGDADALGDFQGSRRFCVVNAVPDRDPEFFRAVDDEIKGVGIDAFHHRLMHEVDMGDFCRHTPVPRGLDQSAA